jgi:hypothetical protein
MGARYKPYITGFAIRSRESGGFQEEAGWPGRFIDQWSRRTRFSMSIPIKIQCGCGQRYAFEAEPVNGQMATAVTCPVCGMDGTEAANQAITYTLSAQAAQPAMAVAAAAPVAQAAPVAARAGGSLRISGVAHAPAATAAAVAEAPQAPAPSHRPRPGRLPGQMDREQAETEARAKVSWGDSPEAVQSFLMIQGFTREEASAYINELFAERASEVRKRGFVNIVLGTLMFLAPIAAVVIFLTTGIMPMIVLAIAVMVGVGGFIMVVRGIFMVVAPRHQKGDVAEQ